MGGKHKPKTNEKDEGVSTYFDVPGIDGSDILYFIAKPPPRTLRGTLTLIQQSILPILKSCNPDSDNYNYTFFGVVGGKSE